MVRRFQIASGASLINPRAETTPQPLRPDIRRTDGVTQGVDDLFVPEIETFNFPTVQYNTIKKGGDTGHDLEESDAPSSP
jgi:hypothetical protein